MKNAVFWDVSPLLTLFFAREFLCPEDGGDTFLRNLCSYNINFPEDGIVRSHRCKNLKS
jgi:hypothetical protein